MARVPPKAQPGDLVADKYRIERVLGEGGMGVVFAAIHVVTGKPVALKWLTNPSPTARQRLLQEAQAAGRIDHPNVVDVYDVGEHDGDMFLVMEWLRGMPLEAAIVAGPIATEEAVRMLMPVLRGVGAAHALGVIHRDLKPENIFLCESRDGSAMTVKVLDFGISKVVSSEDLKLTGQGQVIGTPLYMAPEQLLGKPVSAETDVYALGCILFEMVEGKPAFDAQTFEELTARKITGHPAEHVRAPRSLREVIGRALSPQPSDRHRSVAELGKALEPFVAGQVRFTDTDTDWSAVHHGILQLVKEHTAAMVKPSEESITGMTPTTRMRRWQVPILVGAAAIGVGAGVAVLTLREPPQVESVPLAPEGPAVGSAPPALDRGDAGALAGPNAIVAEQPSVVAPTKVRGTMAPRGMRAAPTKSPTTMFRSGALTEDDF